jgi:endonuclease III
MSHQPSSPDLLPTGDTSRALADLLLANRGDGMNWGELSELSGKPCSKRVANSFLLCCLLDYQIPSNSAWANGERLIKDILGDPDDLWHEITATSEPEWQSKRDTYKLHRFPAAHNRIWRIGKLICEKYNGDARRIWEDRDARSVLETLWAIGAGEQISRMIVGALRDCGQIQASQSDVKGDVYVCRVLGRAMLGKITDAETAVRLAQRLHPDPWRLDSQLWDVGNRFCRKLHPDCRQCYLAPHCAYATGAGKTEPTNIRTLPEKHGSPPMQSSLSGTSQRRTRYLYQLSYEGVAIGTFSWEKADLIAQQIYAAKGQNPTGIRIVGSYRDGIVRDWPFTRPRQRRISELAAFWGN